MSIALLKSKKKQPMMPLPPRQMAVNQITNRPVALPKNLPQIAPPAAAITAPIPAAIPASIPEVNQEVVEDNQAPLPICWSCRGSIQGAVLGCPSCGARYHGEGHDSCNISNIEKCISCSGPTSDFIDG